MTYLYRYENFNADPLFYNELWREYNRNIRKTITTDQ